MSRRIFSLAPAIVALAACEPGNTQSPITGRIQALAVSPISKETLRARFECPEEECELHVLTTELPSSRRTLTRYKGYHRKSGKLIGGAVDEQGAAVDADALEKTEAEDARRSRGALSFSLREWATAASPTQARDIELILFPELNFPDPARLKADPAEEKRWSEQVAEKERAVADTLRECVELGGGSVLDSAHRISLKARVTAEGLRRMQNCPVTIIESVEAPSTLSYVDSIRNSAATSTGNNWALSGGWSETVAILEGGTPGNLLWTLPGIPAIDGIQHPSYPQNLHLTQVTQVIRASTGVQFQGGNAPQAATILGNAFDDSIPWAAAKGARIMNRSFWTGGFEWNMGRLDYYSRQYPTPLFVSGAGNQVHPNFNNVVNFQLNGITVGGANKGFGCNTSDRHCLVAAGSWVNNATLNLGDRELPDILARYTVDGVWPNGTASGTSFAAPQVSAAAARLISSNTQLVGQPYTLRAILMASADADIDWVPWRPFDGISDMDDGTGLLNADLAIETGKYNIPWPGTVAYLSYYRGMWSTGGFNIPGQEQNFPFEVNPYFPTRIRVAVAFQGVPPGGTAGGTSTLDSDIDIVLLTQSGAAVVCSDPGRGERSYSASFKSSYEFFECTVGAGAGDPNGAYRVRVTNYSFNRPGPYAISVVPTLPVNGF